MQRALIYLVAAYLTVCGYLYLTQDEQIYPAARSASVQRMNEALRAAQAVGLTPWEHPTPGASSFQGFVSAHFIQPTSRGTIVVFHGNGDWVGDETEYLAAFTGRGFRVYLYEYPGYGARPGTPHEKSIVPDGRAVIRSLAREGFGPIYVWGESLGSGVGAAVCADSSLPVHGLVLLTPFDRLAAVGLYRYPYIPVTLLLRDRYDSMKNLEHFRHPICVVRSNEDEIIPPPLTLNLFAHLPDPKLMIVQKGVGHDNWPSAPNLGWWDEALDFIAPK